MSNKTGTASDYLDLIDQLDDYLTATGHAWAKSYAGTGNGTLSDYIGTVDSIAETITITATSATNFTVVGSTTGALADATVGTPYTSSVVDFLITSGGTAFVSGDVFTLSTSPPWELLRGEGCADSAKRTGDLANLENLFDGNITTYASVAATACDVEFDMHRPTEIRELLVGIDATTLAPTAWSLQWKNNSGDSWTTAQSWSSVAWSVSSTAQVFTTTSAPGAHRYWRWHVTASSGASLRVASLELRPKVSGQYSVAEHAEFVWRAPGLDGTKQIQIGLQTYGRNDTDTWNLGFNGFRSYDSAVALTAQPNASGQKWLSLLNSPLTYWFVVNGQRVILVVKASTLYQTAYLGFGLPYEPPSVHTYPCIVGASGSVKTLRYDSQSVNYRHPIDPGQYGLAAMYPDAQWRNHANRFIQTSSTGEGAHSTSDGGKVWPTALSGFDDSQPTQIRDNIDGSRPLMPAVIYHYLTPVHVWGEFDGLYWASGFGAVSEATIQEAGFDHLVVGNIFRTGVNHYAAVRLD